MSPEPHSPSPAGIEPGGHAAQFSLLAVVRRLRPSRARPGLGQAPCCAEAAETPWPWTSTCGTDKSRASLRPLAVQARRVRVAFRSSPAKREGAFVRTVTGVSGVRDEPLDLEDMRRRIKGIFIGLIGNLVEWCDFYAAYCSTKTVLRCPSSTRVNSVNTSFSVGLAFQCECTVPGLTSRKSPGFNMTGSLPSSCTVMVPART